MGKTWREANAIYQIAIRSFQDSGSDGVGDIAGIIDRLDYLNGAKDSLGVDTLLLTPFYESPMIDFGYDITDHRKVDKQFGSMEDFDRLLKEAHKHSIKVMIDIIPNHTSVEHEWFRESRSSRDNPKRDWYIWRDPGKGLSAPNDWQSKFGGSVWEYDELTGQYYYHTFFREQPDLNWENPEVRKAIREICTYWLDRGVDGLRIDAAIYLSKDMEHLEGSSYNPEQNDESGMSYGQNQSAYLREITELAHDYEDILVMLEAYPEGKQQTVQRYSDLVAIDDYHAAPLVVEGVWQRFSAADFRSLLSGIALAVDPAEHMPIFCFGNHDNQRLVTKFGAERARAIAVMHMTLPGIPLIYYGEEIGMTNSHKIKADQADGAKQSHMPLGRGVVRTPMQWDNTKHAGFSLGTPWLPHHATDSMNVVAQLMGDNSFLKLYRDLLKLRSEFAALRSGSLEVDDDTGDVLIYERRDDKDDFVVVVNMSESSIIYTSELPVYAVASSHPGDTPYVFDYTSVQLQPDEAVVLKRGVM